MTRPKYPDGLQLKGRRLWQEVRDSRGTLGAGEAILLEEMCRMADRLDRLARSLTGEAFAEYVEDEDSTDEDQRVYVLNVNSAMAEARLTATAMRGYAITLGLDAGQIKDPKGQEGPKGGRRSPKVVGADEAAVKDDEQTAADKADEIARRRAQRMNG